MGFYLVLLRETLSSLPRPLERLVNKLGTELEGVRSKDDQAARRKAAATSPYRQNRKLQPDEVRQLVEQYEAGITIEALAKQFGMHPQTVGRHLRRQGVEKRPVCKMTRDLQKRGAQLYGEGWSTTQIAIEFGVDTNTVRLSLKRFGVVMRSPAEARWHRPDLTAEDIAIAAKGYRDGKTLTQLSDQFGILPKTMRRALVMAGVVIRPRGRRKGSN